MENSNPFRKQFLGQYDFTLRKQAEDSEKKHEVRKDEDKKNLTENNVINMVKFEDCDFENVTIILNFEAPD